MNKLVQKIKTILAENDYVVQHDHDLEWKNNAGITLLVAVAFLIMSFINVNQKSYSMLFSTASCSLIMFAGYFLTRKSHNLTLLHFLMFPIIMITFTMYAVIGGNNGFAVLWLIIVPPIAMVMADFKYGFLMSLYFQVLLLLIFIGPFKSLLRYSYDKTFLLRFPFLYLTTFLLAVFMSAQNRLYRYKLIKREEELHKLGMIDMMTGLRNRNSLNAFAASFSAENTSSAAAVFIDANGLHEVNNQMGHAAGDKMLKQIAGECRICFPGDRIYRMGGDEFLILCMNKSAEMINDAVRCLQEHIGNSGFSVSAGSEIRTSDIDIYEMVKEADRKMLHDKAEYYSRTDYDRRTKKHF